MKRNEFIKSLALGAGTLIMWPGSAVAGRSTVKPKNMLHISKGELKFWSEMINHPSNELAVTETSLVITQASELIRSNQNVQARRVAAIIATKISESSKYWGYFQGSYVRNFNNASERDYYISLLTSNEKYDRVYHMQKDDHTELFSGIRALCAPERAHHEVATVYLSSLRETTTYCSTALVTNVCNEGFKPHKFDPTWSV